MCVVKVQWLLALLEAVAVVVVAVVVILAGVSITLKLKWWRLTICIDSLSADQIRMILILMNIMLQVLARDARAVAC